MAQFWSEVEEEFMRLEEELFGKAPDVPVKDVGKRLPPTNSQSQLVSIKESATEVQNHVT